MEANHYKFPGTPNFAVPSSYPLPHATLCPTFRPTLAVERPISQTRAGGYISPETSPTTPQHHSHGYGNPPPHLRPPISYPRRACEGQTLYRHPGMFHPGQDGTSRYESGFMPMQKQRKPKARKKTEGKQPTFLTKLYDILDQPEYHHIIRWDEVGEVIIIEQPEELAEKILPLVYRQSRFASFSRQLNIYGFMRKVSLRHVDHGICDPDASTWSHPFLRRDSSKDEIIGFKRRVPPRPSQAEKRRSSIPEEVRMSPSSGSDKSHDFSPTGMYHPHRLGSLQEGQPEVFSHHAPMDVDEPHDRLRLPMIRERPIDQPQDFVGFDQQSSTLVPQTAPAKAVSFPVHPRVHQGHIRTRSDQGEPPSATLFSPTSPLAQIAWLPADQLGSFNRKWIEPPRYDPLDMNTWARRGFVGLSLPNEFASSNVFQEPLHMAVQGIATALSDDTATTVSPGIYQDGFSMPPYRTAYVPTTPRTVPMRHQPPIPSSSFSHRARYTLASTRKAYRTPVSKDNVGRSLKDQAVDTGFPSAALEAFYRPPFEGVLPEENGEVATGHD